MYIQAINDPKYKAGAKLLDFQRSRNESYVEDMPNTETMLIKN